MGLRRRQPYSLPQSRACADGSVARAVSGSALASAQLSDRGPVAGAVNAWVGALLFVAAAVAARVVGSSLARRSTCGAMSVLVMVLFASATTFGLTRYRVPVDVLMVVLAGVAASWAWNEREKRRLGDLCRHSSEEL